MPKLPTPNDLLLYGNRLAGFEMTPADSCVAHDTGAPVRKAMATINATTGDLLLARELGCDTVLVHHPLAGSARRSFAGVLDRMVELMVENGCGQDAADAAVDGLRWRCRFNDQASDWDLLVSAAAHIGINLLNIHLAADEIGRVEMVRTVDGLAEDASIADAVERLETIPELAHDANEIICLPEDTSRPLGRLAIMHAGGTNGGLPVAEALFASGVGTVLYIHMDGAGAKTISERAEAGEGGNLIVSGHFASDAIGMNILLAQAEAEFGVEFVRHGGLLPFAARSV